MFAKVKRIIARARERFSPICHRLKLARTLGKTGCPLCLSHVFLALVSIGAVSGGNLYAGTCRTCGERHTVEAQSPEDAARLIYLELLKRKGGG